MPLVEIVRAPSTSDATLSTALQFVQKIGKTPVIVKDSPGFLVNRVLVPYLLEACKLFANGMDPQAIDQAMLEFGMPMGPLRLLDEVGLDVGKHVAETLIAAYSDRMALPPMMEAMIEQGCLGRKVGKGFYVYGKEQPEPNPLALQLQKNTGQRLQNSADYLAELMSNEAARCLDEGIVESAEAIDLAMVLGTGYAPFRGGPLHYADECKLIRPKFFKDAPPIRMAG
jgi:3-hydroxyacyl-CoA dehydrogenase/enoyl-CoA hydratase/3-hydroxybutyryl-CoA epimerase